MDVPEAHGNEFQMIVADFKDKNGLYATSSSEGGVDWEGRPSTLHGGRSSHLRVHIGLQMQLSFPGKGHRGSTRALCMAPNFWASVWLPLPAEFPQQPRRECWLGDCQGTHLWPVKWEEHKDTLWRGYEWTGRGSRLSSSRLCFLFQVCSLYLWFTKTF